MSLAQYKLFKKTADEDKDRGLLNAHKAGLTSALAGLLLGKGAPAAAGAGRLATGIAALRTTRTRRIVSGYVAGQAAVHGTRVATAGTKDAYGDRSRAAKHAEKVPMWAGLAGAGLLAKKRITGKLFARRSEQITFSVMSEIRSVAKKKGFQQGAALAGGITVADVVTHAALPGQDQTRTQAAGRGLVQGALYGSVLAGSEPVLARVLKRARFAARGRAVLFSREQIINDKWVKINPLAAASGEQQGYKPRIDTNGQYVRGSGGKIKLDPHNVGVSHAQVLRSAYNQGVTINRYGGRAGRLGKDAVGAFRGEKKVDERGRPMKREWEKSWFRNAAGAALIGGGLIANAHAMKKFPRYRAKIVGAKSWVKAKANKLVPDSFPVTTQGYARQLRGMILFDAWAEERGWDVRDPRGRSARVFAPGSRRRDRREKKSYETVGFLRKAAVAVGVGALALGGVGGFLLGKRTVKAPIIKTIIKKPRPGKGALATPTQPGQFIVHSGGAA